MKKMLAFLFIIASACGHNRTDLLKTEIKLQDSLRKLTLEENQRGEDAITTPSKIYPAAASQNPFKILKLKNRIDSIEKILKNN